MQYLNIRSFSGAYYLSRRVILIKWSDLAQHNLFEHGGVFKVESRYFLLELVLSGRTISDRFVITLPSTDRGLKIYCLSVSETSRKPVLRTGI